MGFIKGRRIMTEMMPLMDVLETGKFVQAIKYGSAPLQRLADRRSERSLPCSNVIDECDIGLHKPPPIIRRHFNINCAAFLCVAFSYNL